MTKFVKCNEAVVMGALYVFTSARTWFGDAAEDEEEEF